ncbi:glutamine synthetase family protein [Candidatus Poriferisocius sp.]|uniref:glutamine synthetase family protein n=1 Tax=Candidatus Poriferisocius sp. TaxID=3101276 RepID=UPI003B5C98F3
MADTPSFDDFHAACRKAEVHTVEVATPDTQGHLRGKRVPVDRFFRTTATDGLNIADAIFTFDMQNDLPDHPFINMESGFLDCRLVPDPSTARIFSHRPGYALVFSDAFDPHDRPHPAAPRHVLADQIQRCRQAGLDPVVATELEFYLCTPDWKPVQDHIQYSSLTDAMGVEDCVAEMRHALGAAGLEVESSNPEYGPGQIEINVAHADAMTCADNTVLLKSIVKQVAVRHGMRATFMPKLWTEPSGSGMHIHTSLSEDGNNAFADSEGGPNQLMGHWVAGLTEHAEAMTLLAAPTINGPKRIRPYTFVPTHVHWGLDNRSMMCRCLCEAGSPANRVEHRLAGADANPYLMIAAILAAGLDGIERALPLPPMSEGDMYADAGDARPLPTDLAGAIAAYRNSPLAEMLGEMFSAGFLTLADHELSLAAENAPHPDEVNDWERARYADHC